VFGFGQIVDEFFTPSERDGASQYRLTVTRFPRWFRQVRRAAQHAWFSLPIMDHFQRNGHSGFAGAENDASPNRAFIRADHDATRRTPLRNWFQMMSNHSESVIFQSPEVINDTGYSEKIHSRMAILCGCRVGFGQIKRSPSSSCWDIAEWRQWLFHAAPRCVR